MIVYLVFAIPYDAFYSGTYFCLNSAKLKDKNFILREVGYEAEG